MPSPKYSVGDILIYPGYFYNSPTEFEFQVASFYYDNTLQTYIYYGIDLDDNCREDEVISVKSLESSSGD